MVQPVARSKYFAEKSAMSRSTIILANEFVAVGEDAAKSVRAFVRAVQKVDALASHGYFKDLNRRTGEERDIASNWIVVYASAWSLDADDACDLFVREVLQRHTTQRHAREKLALKMHNAASDATSGAISESHRIEHPCKLLTSCIHRSPRRNLKLVKLDVDTKEAQKILCIKRCLAPCTVRLVCETKNGFHVVLERNSTMKDLHQYV